MIDAQVLAFTGIAALITITPGSDTMLVVRSALARGRRAGLLTVLGIGCGLFVHATLSALGLSAVLLRSARAFEIVKLAGAAYLVFLGVQSVRGSLRGGPETERPPQDVGARRAFVEGLLNNVLNPRRWPSSTSRSCRSSSGAPTRSWRSRSCSRPFTSSRG